MIGCLTGRVRTEGLLICYPLMFQAYLSSDEFERLFKMSRLAFQRLPEWKKNDLKRRLDLY